SLFLAAELSLLPIRLGLAVHLGLPVDLGLAVSLDRRLGLGLLSCEQLGVLPLALRFLGRLRLGLRCLLLGLRVDLRLLGLSPVLLLGGLGVRLHHRLLLLLGAAGILPRELRSRIGPLGLL